MSIYIKELSGLGYTTYRKDNKLVKTSTVPGNIMLLLETQAEVDDTDLQLEAPLKKCVFDGRPTKFYRMVNSQSIAVCDEDYHTKTLGQLAEQVRLNEEAKGEKVEQH